MKPYQLFEYLIGKNNLDAAQMSQAIEQCMNGQFSDIQIATFLALMRMKGETTEELTVAAKIMQNFATPIDLGTDLIDIVGTGGDGRNTFNVSTASSFIVAAAGYKVAKHGNRSVSSRSGSADLLEYAGFNLNLSHEQMKRCMSECNLVFLFAPQHHPAMQHARLARQQLGIRTLFNLLGPLINPAQVKKQVVGVFSSQWMKPLVSVLAHLGSERALVISSLDGLDEISIAAPTQVIEYHLGLYTPWTINPKDYGIEHKTLAGLTVDSPKQSLQIIERIFSGENGPARDIVLLNAAATIYCANQQFSFAQAIELTRHTLDSGKAGSLFDTLRQLTQES